jgi:hypothetical protein
MLLVRFRTIHPHAAESVFVGFFAKFCAIQSVSHPVSCLSLKRRMQRKIARRKPQRFTKPNQAFGIDTEKREPQTVCYVLNAAKSLRTGCFRRVVA